MSYDEASIPIVEHAMLKLTKAGKILDFGCGKGVGMKRFSSREWDAFGIDTSIKDLKTASRYGNVVCGSGEKLTFAAESFDAVISSNVLHHMKRPSVALSEIWTCLKRGGFFLLAESTEDNPFLRILRYVYPRFEGVPVQSRFKWQDIQTLLQRNGFKILRQKRDGLFAWTCLELARKVKASRRIALTLFPKLLLLEKRLEKRLEKYCVRYYCLLQKVKKDYAP